jgi:amidase
LTASTPGHSTDIPEIMALPADEVPPALSDRLLSSVELTARCRARIATVDGVLRAVIALDDTAGDQARASDRRRAIGGIRGPLDGIPILIKDNIDTAGLATTAGSRLLAGSPPRRDAEIVARIRAAGAVVLGKTNLTEWANFRTSKGCEGWSAVRGQTRNPHQIDRSPFGSSAGSAVAVAAGMAPLALGTETDGSIVCPAGACGVVGFKPESGLLPSGGVVPISQAADAVGIFAARVSDVAVALSVLTGRVPGSVPAMSLAGRRLGLWRVDGMPNDVNRLLDDVSTALRRAGAQVVPIGLAVSRSLLVQWFRGLYADFRPSLEAYLRTREGVPQTLPELIEANVADGVELSLFGQDVFEQIAAMTPERCAAWAPGQQEAQRAARALIDGALLRHDIDVVLAPSNEPAWPIDHENGDPPTYNSSTTAAMAGYPNISVPAGFVDGLPVGLSVFGPSRATRLLPFAAAVERVLRRRAG